MKTVTILLSFLVNDYGIIHLAIYETKFANCDQAEQAALEHARIKYIKTGKADQVSIESCEPTNAK